MKLLLTYPAEYSSTQYDIGQSTWAVKSSIRPALLFYTTDSWNYFGDGWWAHIAPYPIGAECSTAFSNDIHKKAQLTPRSARDSLVNRNAIPAVAENGVFSYPCHIWRPRSLSSRWNFRNYGTFVPAYFRSRERKFHRWNFRSLELSLPNIIYVLTCWNFALYFVCLLDRTLTT